MFISWGFIWFQIYKRGGFRAILLFHRVPRKPSRRPSFSVAYRRPWLFFFVYEIGISIILYVLIIFKTNQFLLYYTFSFSRQIITIKGRASFYNLRGPNWKEKKKKKLTEKFYLGARSQILKWLCP